MGLTDKEKIKRMFAMVILGFSAKLICWIYDAHIDKSVWASADGWKDTVHWKMVIRSTKSQIKRGANIKSLHTIIQ